jgi:hypothetical protein
MSLSSLRFWAFSELEKNYPLPWIRNHHVCCRMYFCGALSHGATNLLDISYMCQNINREVPLLKRLFKSTRPSDRDNLFELQVISSVHLLNRKRKCVLGLSLQQDLTFIVSLLLSVAFVGVGCRNRKSSQRRGSLKYENLC